MFWYFIFRYYNNFYEGHFYLYKHNTLPYEVNSEDTFILKKC